MSKEKLTTKEFSFAYHPLTQLVGFKKCDHCPDLGLPLVKVVVARDVVCPNYSSSSLENISLN